MQSRRTFLSFLVATATLLFASAVETWPEQRLGSWPGPIAPVTEVDIGAYTGRWYQASELKCSAKREGAGRVGGRACPR